MGRYDPPANFTEAFNALGLGMELIGKREFDRYYVERADSPVGELAQRIKMERGPAKIIFTGLGKSGKTTELFRLVHICSRILIL